MRLYYFMKTTITYKDIWQIAYPIMIGAIAENINTAINTAFVGQLGQVSVGAVGLGGLFYFNFAILALGLAGGIQTIIGRRNGEEHFEEAGTILTHGMILFTFLALLMLGLMHLFASSLLRYFISSTQIYEACASYLSIRMYGIVFICLMVCLRSFYIGITHTRVITIITFLSAGINVLFDYLLIFGHGPFKKYGIIGAAYSSILAEGIAFGGYFLITMFIPVVKKYKALRFSKFQIKYIWNILKTGTPLMIQSWVSFSSWLLFFIVIEKIGERTLAVSTIIKNIYMLFMIPLWGFAAASNSLTANIIGQNRTEEVINLLRKIAWLATLIVAIPVVICFCFPEPIIGIFTNRSDIIMEGTAPLRIVAVALLMFPAAFVFLNGVSGSGDTKFALYIELVTILIYVSYFVSMAKVWHMGISFIWTAELVYMVLMGLGSYWRLKSGLWKGKIV